jgi:tyrosyl-tRNA synthetase
MESQKIITNDEAIEKFFDRKIDKIYPSVEEFKKALKFGKRLRFYMGADSTAPKLHIGHILPFLKMAELQKMGHEIIFLIGDFTAMIGDPTDKSSARVKLTKEVVNENAKNFQSQIDKIIDFESKENPAKVEYNSKWDSKLNFEDVIELASNFTVQQMIERDMFQKRLQDKKPIFLHEFLYPLIQGYDSVAMDVDGEFGGTDQTFNMLAGRDLVKVYNKKDKFVITTKLLLSSDGVNKMSKSVGNCIYIKDSPEEKYGKVMAIPDSLLIHYYELLSDQDENGFAILKEKVTQNENPMQIKKDLAYIVVRMFDGEDSAQKAQKFFEDTVQNKQIPTEIETISKDTLRIEGGIITLKDLLVKMGFVDSNSDAKRLILDNAVEIDDIVITDPNTQININSTTLVKAGKRKWKKLI